MLACDEHCVYTRCNLHNVHVYMYLRGGARHAATVPVKELERQLQPARSSLQFRLNPLQDQLLRFAYRHAVHGRMDILVRLGALAKKRQELRHRDLCRVTSQSQSGSAK